MAAAYNAVAIFLTDFLFGSRWFKMGIIELFSIAVGLSADAFAASLCKGMNMKKTNVKQAALISFSFGFFQGAMPIIGWLLGINFEKYINAFASPIAFVILLAIGAKMIYDSIKGGDDEEKEASTNFKEVIFLSVATSIDALAVGLSFAFLGSDIWLSSLLIGVVTFVICFAGFFIGNKFGDKFKDKAGIFGGTVLIIIAIKILLEYFNII